MNDTRTLRLTLDVTYDLNGEALDAMRTMLRSMVGHALANGELTGSTAAEIEKWSLEVLEVNRPPEPGQQTDAEKYGIKVGQIYIAADGGKYGHLVTDVTTYAHVGDIITTPFTRKAWNDPGNRIDAFKLAMVRYCTVAEMPEWGPKP